MLTIITTSSIPVVKSGEPIEPLISSALSDDGIMLKDNDILVVAQKIVSLCENRQIQLNSVNVSSEANQLASETGKDPRIVELILREPDAIVRQKMGVIIARHKLGLVCANAGIDQSNIDHSNGETALLLPENPDASAAQLKEKIKQRTNKNIGVIISDSMNRPWRLGSVGISIGAAGLGLLDNKIGAKDLYGRTLLNTVINRSDALAGAAVLLMGEAAEATPFAIIRGCELGEDNQGARSLVRPLDEDMFP